MREQDSLFIDNEKQANRYTAISLLVSAGIVLLVWLLNTLNFFIVDKTLMNIVMPIAIVFLVTPSIIGLCKNFESCKWKYVIMLAFIFGLGALSASLTVQLILAWACPMIISCHYYSPKFTRFTLIGTLVAMLISFYLGIFIGVWDSNIMRSNESINVISERIAYIKEELANDNNILLRALNFYYIPRAMILFVVYIVCITLSKRTHNLITKHSEVEKEKHRIGTELNVATNIQASMLPRIFPAFPEHKEFDLFASMTPAKEVGGDVYDFFLVDEDHLALVMADVSGKGVPAALFMVISKTLIKNYAQTGLSPKETLRKVNIQLCEGNEVNMFVTVWLGIYNIKTRTLVASNAGHEFPVIRRGNGDFELYKDKHGFVLAGMEMSKYTEYEVQLDIGDEIFVYTDGVPEATNINNELFGTERMLESLNKHKGAKMEDLLILIKEDVDEFVGGAPQFDDITMLAFKVKE